MIGELKDLLGKEALIGIVAYAGIAWLAAGPISERVAEREFLPRCVAGITNSAGKLPSGTSDDEVALLVWKETMKSVDGPLGDLLNGLVRSPLDQIEAKRRRLAERAAAGAPDRCHCRMSMALSYTRHDWALWVGTLKLHTPQSVRSFETLMATIDRDGLCKEGGLS